MNRCKPIAGFEGKYFIYDDGRVYRAKCKFRRNSIFLKPLGKRYLRVSLQKDRKAKFFSIHRLVALAFVPNPDNKPIANHKDGDKHNNLFTNLEWNTPRENLMHSIEVLKRNRNTEKQRLSAVKVGKKKRILTMEQAQEIRTTHKNVFARILSEKYGVSLPTIDRIKAYKTYI